MKLLMVVLLMVSCSASHLLAQTKVIDRFTFSVSGGAAIPMGVFGKKDIVNSAIYMPGVPSPWIIGIDKTKSGFAETGHYYNAQLSYRITDHIGFLIRSGQTVNSVQTSGITHFLTQTHYNQVFEHVDYSIFSVLPGISYAMKLKNWNINLAILGGFARSNYPYYKSTLLYTGPTSPSIWTHDGERPSLKAFMGGGLLCINYKIKRITAGIEMVYQKANFRYDMSTRVIPGFSPNPEIHDKVKVSILNIGLQLAYPISL